MVFNMGNQTFTQEMKMERVLIREASLAMVPCHSKAMLVNIVTMDASMESCHTTKMKQKSKL